MKYSQAPLTIALIAVLSCSINSGHASTVADTLIFCTALGNAELPRNNQYFLGESDTTSTVCSVHLWTTQEVSTPCGDSVRYDVRLYLFDGPGFVQVIEPSVVPLENQKASLTFDTRTNSLSPDHPLILSGVPYTNNRCQGAPGNDDLHRLVWRVVDACGDTTVYESRLRVDDCTPPRPVCVGLSSIVMPSGGTVTIWAKDFNAVSYDDCTSGDDLTFSFGGDEFVPSRKLDCIDLCELGLSYLVEIWVADEGFDVDCNGTIEWTEQNKDYCTTFIILDDIPNTCECYMTGRRIRTERGAGISGVTVQFESMGQVIDEYITGSSGYYQFGFVNPLIEGDIVPQLHDNHRNGVSTLDLVRLQKHLIGIQPLTSPYQRIAADVNNSAGITLFDLLDMRKLILGVLMEFPNSPSWRFIPEAFEFPDPNNPWVYPELITTALTPFVNGNFIGVKIGDLSGSLGFADEDIVVRSSKASLRLGVSATDVKANDRVDISFYPGAIQNLLGFQFTLELSGLDMVDASSGQVEIGSANIGIHHNALTMSWSSPISVSIEDDEVLFTLSFVATRDGNLGDMLALSSETTAAEGYLEKDEAIEIIGVTLSFESREELLAQKFKLYQNTPNPFSDQTSISFDIPDAMHGTLQVFDVYGHEISRVDEAFGGGRNTVEVRARDLNGPGVYCYRLNAGTFSATRKFINN